MRISDWSSVVCSSDLVEDQPRMVILRVAQQIRLAVEDEARPFEVGAKHGWIDAMKLFDNRTRVAARVRRVIDHTDYPSGLRRRENLGQHGGQTGRASGRERGSQCG